MPAEEELKKVYDFGVLSRVENARFCAGGRWRWGFNQITIAGQRLDQLGSLDGELLAEGGGRVSSTRLAVISKFED